MHEPDLPPRDSEIARCKNCGAWYHTSQECACANGGSCKECGSKTPLAIGTKRPRMYCSRPCQDRASNRKRRTSPTKPQGKRRADKWMDSALCAQVDPELFFADHRDAINQAVALSICEGCPVKAPCLLEGMDHEYGVWGGWAESERKVLKTRLETINPAAHAEIIKSAAQSGSEIIKQIRR